MVVFLMTFCTLFHWEVLKEHCCRCEEYTANYRAKCSDEWNITLNFSVQKKHELSCLTFVMMTASFEHLEQSWKCIHTQLSYHGQEHRVYTSRSVAVAALMLVLGASGEFSEAQY